MSFEPACVDKILVRGDTRRYRVTVREPKTGDNQDPKRINLTGASALFTAKRQDQENKFRPVATPDIEKTSDDLTQIEILDQTVDSDTEGQLVIKLAPEDTRFLDPGIYVYDVQVTTALGEVYTVTRGRIFLKADASSAEDLTPP